MRVKVRKIYDKYGMFSILIYRMAKRLCTVMHSLCLFGMDRQKKALIYREKRKKQIVFIHMM